MASPKMEGPFLKTPLGIWVSLGEYWASYQARVMYDTCGQTPLFESTLSESQSTHITHALRGPKDQETYVVFLLQQRLEL